MAESSSQHTHAHHHTEAPREQFDTAEDMLDRAVENAIVRGIFQHNDASRRRFLQYVGGGTLAAALSTRLTFPLNKKTEPL